MKGSGFVLVLLFMFVSFGMIAAPTILEIKYKSITIDGKTVKVATIEQPDGTWGYYGKEGEIFDVIIKNKLSEPTAIHWHGLILPNSQDGVSGVTQPDPIASGGEYHYKFKLSQSGTYWMHSHYGLQGQDMVEAPLIILTSEEINHTKGITIKKYKQVVVMFQDFSFRSPEAILKSLQSQGSSEPDTAVNDDDKKSGMNMGNTSGSGKANKNTTSAQNPDLNDVRYDSYLTNYHTNLDPEIVHVYPGEKVKIRFINGSAASNFWVYLGKLSGELVSVDGQKVEPIKVDKIQLAIAQRADVIIIIPKEGGIFQILGQVEGLKDQTGLILTTKKNTKGLKINPEAKKAAPVLNYQQEFLLGSIAKLYPEKSSVTVNIKLSGDMNKYIWKINGQAWPDITPIQIELNQRVIMIFDNQSMMSHPMHLHGYDFKITSIDGKAVNGPFRDTVLVMPKSKVTVEFNAVYPGKWILHCHNLYHLAAGMMTYLQVNPKLKDKYFNMKNNGAYR